MTAFNRAQHPIGSEFLVTGIGEGSDVTHVEVVRYASNGFVCLRDVEADTREWYGKTALKDICVVARVEPIIKGDAQPFVRNPPLNETPAAYRYDTTLLSAVPTPGDIRTITLALEAGNFIAAVKHFREVTGASLFDAKTAIDRYKASRRVC